MGTCSQSVRTNTFGGVVVCFFEVTFDIPASGCLCIQLMSHHHWSQPSTLCLLLTALTAHSPVLSACTLCLILESDRARTSRRPAANPSHASGCLCLHLCFSALPLSSSCTASQVPALPPFCRSARIGEFVDCELGISRRRDDEVVRAI